MCAGNFSFITKLVLMSISRIFCSKILSKICAKVFEIEIGLKLLRELFGFFLSLIIGIICDMFNFEVHHGKKYI